MRLNRLWRTANYAPRGDIADYGDGNAAAQIVEIMRRELG